MTTLSNGQNIDGWLWERVGGSEITPENEPHVENLEEYYQGLVEAREAQRKRAIKEGRMDPGGQQKHVRDAITVKGTCPDMCPRFERYRRQRENNLMRWETLPPPNNKRIDHTKAVKMYERADGDKAIPSDIRPEPILLKSLDYLLYDLLPKHGFNPTYAYIRDRTRSIRHDADLQMLCTLGLVTALKRIARFHILALHALETTELQQEFKMIADSLKSIKYAWVDLRTSKTAFEDELEIRLYMRLMFIRENVEMLHDVSPAVAASPAFQLMTQFRTHVRTFTGPIDRKTFLKVGEEGMRIYREMITVLAGNRDDESPAFRTRAGTMFLISCLIEGIFRKGTIGEERMQELRGSLTEIDLIDGTEGSTGGPVNPAEVVADEVGDFLSEDGEFEDQAAREPEFSTAIPAPGNQVKSIFEDENYVSPFGVFGESPFGGAAQSAFASGSGQSAFTSAPAQNTFSAFSGNTNTSTPTSFAINDSSAFAPQGASANSFSAFSAPANNTSAVSAFGIGSPPKSAFGDPSIPFPTSGINFAGPSTSVLSSTPMGGFSTTPTHPPPTTSIFTQTTSTRVKDDSHPQPPFATLNPDASPFAPSFPQPTTTSTFVTPPKNTNLTSTMSIHFPSTTPTVTPPSMSSAFGAFKPPPLPPGLFSSTPPSQPVAQPSAPGILPRIDTQLFPAPDESSLPSPALPDAPKPHLISLPSTPSLDGISSASMPLGRPPHAFAPSNPSPLRSGQNLGPGIPFPTPTPKKDKTLLKGALLGKLDISNLPFDGKSKDGTLSPLVFGTPSVSRMPSMENLQGTPSVKGLGLVNGVSGSPIVDSREVRENTMITPTSTTQQDGEAMKKEKTEKEKEKKKEDELRVLERRFVMMKAMELWMQKAIDRAAWIEAVERSREYGKQVKKKRHTLSQSVPNSHQDMTSFRGTSPALSESNKRRRLISDPGSESEFGGSEWSDGASALKRKRRSSGKYEKPRTDDQLERRLVEKHQENTIRWTPNSFLDHVKLRERSYTDDQRSFRVLPKNRAPWRLWVCSNPDNDGTAIWVEKKFGVASATEEDTLGGKWIKNSIYEVPVSPDLGRTGPASPGLLVFELTPLERIPDDLERKYRILDDCSRLRDLVETLPTRRQYVPALLVLHWPAPGTASIPQDILDSVTSYVRQGTLCNFSLFDCSMPSLDLDPKFKSAVGKLRLDFEGKRAKRMSFRNVYDLFEPSLREFVDEWYTICCARNPMFHWELYSNLVKAYVALLDLVGGILGGFLETEVKDLLLDTLDLTNCKDDESAYAVTLDWLSSLQGHSTDFAMADLEGHRDLEQPFPGRALLDHLKALLYSAVDRALSAKWPGETSFLVLIQDLESGVEEAKQAIIERQAEVSRSYTLLSRRSPKRLASSLQSSTSSSSSQTNSTKRQRLSNDAPEKDGTISAFLTPDPSPSVGPTSLAGDDASMQVDELDGIPLLSSSSGTPKGKVAISMLRELTKSMKTRYTSNGS